MKLLDYLKKIGPSGSLEQVAPDRSEREPVWDMVIRDMLARKAMGKERYGTFLQTFNRRSAALDLYQELLDAAVYMRQMIEEWDAMRYVVACAVDFVNIGGEEKLERLRNAVIEYAQKTK